MLRISAVEYLNTALFVEGLRNSLPSGWCDLRLDNPAVCARKMKNAQADIGLVPVAQIPEINPRFIFGDYCIGATGPVRTVKLFSRRPLQDLRSIVLDPHSNTSVQLLKILSDKFWKTELAQN